MRRRLPSNFVQMKNTSERTLARPGPWLVLGLLFFFCTLLAGASAIAQEVEPTSVTPDSIRPGNANSSSESPASSHELYLPGILLSPSISPEQDRAPEGSPFHMALPTRTEYTVQPGDTLLTAALEMGVDLEQMACLISPDFTWDQPLVIGDVLTVPGTPFRCHRVARGETVAKIAARYDAPEAGIWAEEWNELLGEPLVGQNLRVPLTAQNDQLTGAVPISTGWRNQGVGPPVDLAVGGPLPRGSAFQLPPNWPYGSGQFAWPIYGWLSQGYRVGHSAIDVAAPTGTPVTAADRGVVIRAGWSEIGYGNFVIIDHNIDYITLYAHLSEIVVTEGQVVAQGQLIGKVGSTGNSTGPHLHFEIRDFGRRIDPLGLLPR